MSDNEKIRVTISVAEIMHVLKCKRCKQAVRDLVITKLVSLNRQSIESKADEILGGEM